jgi:hypothetical protein
MQKQARVEELRTLSASCLPFYVASALDLKGLKESFKPMALADYIWLGHIPHTASSNFLDALGDYISPCGIYILF